MTISKCFKEDISVVVSNYFINKYLFTNDQILSSSRYNFPVMKEFSYNRRFAPFI